MIQDNYLGQINLWAANATPRGWAECDGRLLKKAEYMAVHSLIGDHFGGDDEHFALPDLRGKAVPGYHFIIALAGIWPNAAK